MCLLGGVRVDVDVPVRVDGCVCLCVGVSYKGGERVSLEKIMF